MNESTKPTKSVDKQNTLVLINHKTPDMLYDRNVSDNKLTC